jgi:hypothetical protein
VAVFDLRRDSEASLMVKVAFSEPRQKVAAARRATEPVAVRA